MTDIEKSRDNHWRDRLETKKLETKRGVPESYDNCLVPSEPELVRLMQQRTRRNYQPRILTTTINIGEGYKE